MDRVTSHSGDDRRKLCASRGIDPSQHCCIDMAWFITDPVEWESQGSNPTMLWIKSWNEYRINIPRGGNSAILIRFCPWCSARLPDSLHDKWNTTLYAMGFDDPGEQEIPERFNSDEWWRHTGGR